MKTGWSPELSEEELESRTSFWSQQYWNRQVEGHKLYKVVADCIVRLQELGEGIDICRTHKGKFSDELPGELCHETDSGDFFTIQVPKHFLPPKP